MHILIIGVAGCAASVEERPLVLSKEFRAQLTKVTVIPADYTPYVKLKSSTKEPLEGLGDYVEQGAAAGAGSAVTLGVTATTIGAIVGGLLGAAYTVSNEESVLTGKEGAITRGEAIAVVQKAVIELRMQEALQEQVVKQARQKTHYEIVSVPEMDARLVGQEGTGKETVLIPYVLSFGLSQTHPVGSSRFAMYMRAKVRLIDLEDGKELCNVNPGYKTDYYEYTHWSSDDGQQFLEAINTGYQNIAEQIVEELFLRQ